MAERTRVVIVGGGFGGLEAAKALAGSDVDVTVVDRRNYHLFQPLLYQVAMAGLSPGEIASPIRAIVAHDPNVRVVLGEVTGIEVAARQVRLRHDVLPYDFLVLAAGARSSYFGHEAWEPYAPSLKSVEDALEIRRRVLLAFEEAERSTETRERKRYLTFAVVGGGPTGVELAGAIAELSRYALARDFRSIDPRETRVVLLEGGPRILPTFPTSLSESAVEQLGELGVEVHTSARVVCIDEHGVELDEATDADELPGLGSGKERERIAAATVLWGAGVRASELGEALGVPRDRGGRVIVGPDCSIPGHPEVFVIGDMARFEENGTPLPGVSPVAMQQARYVGRIILAEARSGHAARKPFHYVDKGSMATIGRSRAIAWVRGIQMHGFLAWLAWLVIHIFYLIGFRNRVTVLLNWAWSYFAYERGARLITETGWHAAEMQRAGDLAATGSRGASDRATQAPAMSPEPPAQAPAMSFKSEASA